jgi:hypothetical protein
MPVIAVTFVALLMLSTPQPSAAQAGLDPDRGVLRSAFADVVMQRLADLTTAPQRVTNTVHPDARAVAPAAPAQWTPITAAVPGVLVQGTLNGDPQARFLIRLPDSWNGKLVVAGASSTRSELNGDIIISDFVLQRGYAYAAQNKGMQNAVLPAPLTERACPLLPVADFGSAPPTNILVDFFLLDDDNSMVEWARRIVEAGVLGQAVVHEHYGRKPSFTYAAGISKGGWQVRKAVEDHPGVFDGGLDWEGPYWHSERANFIGELPAALKNYPAYRATGHDPASAAAQAIREAGYPPDVRDNGTGLWELNRRALWEVTECLFVKELDPTYNSGPGNFAAFADYDFTTRPHSVQQTISHFENTGRLRRPLITVHGTLDALLPIASHARDYRAKVEAEGFGENHRVYEIQNGNHLDSFVGAAPLAQLPSLELILPHFHEAFMRLEQWVELGTPAPPHQCVPRGGTMVAVPAEIECAELFVP